VKVQLLLCRVNESFVFFGATWALGSSRLALIGGTVLISAGSLLFLSVRSDLYYEAYARNVARSSTWLVESILSGC
jgi:hypothetical protein